MAKSLRFSIIWLIVFISLFILFSIASHAYNKNIKFIGDELFATYQNYMPLSSAYTESIGAYTYHDEKEKIKSKIGTDFRLFLADKASEDAERARKFMPFLGMVFLIVAGIGFVSLIIYFILGLIKSIKTKKFDVKYLVPSLVFFCGLGSVVGLFSYQSSTENRNIFEKV